MAFERLKAVNVIAEDVALLPALSLAVAVKVCVLLVSVVVSRFAVRVPAELLAKTTPSISRLSEKSPDVTCPPITGSEAMDDTDIVPENVWPEVLGFVTLTVGAVVSGANCVVKVLSLEVAVLPGVSMEIAW